MNGHLRHGKEIGERIQLHFAKCSGARGVDMVEAANSGHPGMPIGMADAATPLFRGHLKFYATAGPEALYAHFGITNEVIVAKSTFAFGTGLI